MPPPVSMPVSRRLGTSHAKRITVPPRSAIRRSHDVPNDSIDLPLRLCTHVDTILRTQQGGLTTVSLSYSYSLSPPAAGGQLLKSQIGTHGDTHDVSALANHDPIRSMASV